MSTYVAFTSPSSPASLTIHRLTHASSITSLPRDLQSHSISNPSFPSETTILDVKFADDAALLVLIHSAHSKDHKDEGDIQGYRILRLPYNITTQSDSPPLTYHTLPTSETANHLLPAGSAPASSSRTMTSLTPAAVQQYTIHVFEREGRFTPAKLAVNGRKGRRVVVVLAKDGKHYRVLDMDYPSQREEEEGETVLDLEGEVGEDGDTVMIGL